jgi:hypothetical protein
MRSLTATTIAIAATCALAQRPASAQSVSATVEAVVGFAPRTSLTVSTRLLQFEVVDPARPSVATVEFEARARTHTGSEVVLSVEPLRAPEGPVGAADAECAVTFVGQGTGTTGAALAPGGQSVVGRWAGSGRHSGHVVFALRASTPGTYVVPVRFVLSVP